jgi:hypothetical protein
VGIQFKQDDGRLTTDLYGTVSGFGTGQVIRGGPNGEALDID